MGAAASTRRDESNGQTIVRLNQVSQVLRVYQHDSTGEVMVLINQDIVSALGERDARGWYPVKVSKEQEKYFKQVKIEIGIPDLNARIIPIAAASDERNRGMPVADLDFRQRGMTTAATSSSDRNNHEIIVDQKRSVHKYSPSKQTEPDNLMKAKLTALRSAAVQMSGELSFPDHDRSGDSKEMDIDYAADYKPTRPTFVDGAKSRVRGKFRSFEPKPYFPPAYRQLNDKSIDDLRSQSISMSYASFSIHNDNTAKKTPRDETNRSASSDNSSSKSSNRSTSGTGSKQVICNDCGKVFWGYTAADALEDHAVLCASQQQMRQAFTRINQTLHSDLEELSTMERMDGPQQMTLLRTQSVEELATRLKINLVKIINIDYQNANLQQCTRLQRSLTRLLNDVEAIIGDLNTNSAGAQFLNACQVIIQRVAHQLTEKMNIIEQFKECLLGLKDFDLCKAIGKGGFGAVYLARRTANRKYCAIKAMNTQSIRKANSQAQILRERAAMQHANKYSDYYVRLLCSFQFRGWLFMVMEYMPGGDCLTLLLAMRRFPEVVAQHFIAQVAVAVKCMHMHGVVHRDIKPDNIMITSRGHAKLGDFGLIVPYVKDSSTASTPNPSAHNNNTTGKLSPRASAMSSVSSQSSPVQRQGKGGFPTASNGGLALWLDQSDLALPKNNDLSNSVPSADSDSSSIYFVNPNNGRNMLNSRVGNYHYSCPEIVVGTAYDHTVDYWALGVMTFHFISGRTPFEGKDKKQTMDNIAMHNANWSAIPKDTSNECKAFIEQIISHPPKQRLGFHSPNEVLGHDFFADIDFSTLHDGYGPLFPQMTPPPATTEGGGGKISGRSSPSITPKTVNDKAAGEPPLFTMLSEEEMKNIPDFLHDNHGMMDLPDGITDEREFENYTLYP